MHSTDYIIIFWCINSFDEISHETRISYEYECDWIWVLKCHLVNSCVRLYEFGYELEMTLSLWVSLSFHSLSIVWVWLVKWVIQCVAHWVCTYVFTSFKTVSQVFVHKFYSVVIGQWPTSLIVFVFEVFEVSSCVVPSDS